jgi:hypothetical protein
MIVPVPSMRFIRPPSIYVSSRSRRGQLWRELRDQGVPIAASWIDESGPGETSDFGDLYNRCTREAARAAVNIWLALPEDAPWFGALLEVGATLGSGGQVIIVTDDVSVVRGWDQHPKVTVIDNLHTACVVAMRMIGAIP